MASHPVTTIETETTTIEVVTHEALLDEPEGEEQGISAAAAAAAIQPHLMSLQGHSPSSQGQGMIRGGTGTSTSGLGGVKLEIDESQERCLTSLLELSSGLDAEILLQAFGPKLFDRFTVWDLMMSKARDAAGKSPEIGAVPLLIDDMERILLEMKVLVEGIMNFVPDKAYSGTAKKRPRLDKNEMVINDLVGTALCIETGIWRQKSAEDIEYDIPIEMDKLFPEKRIEVQLDGEIRKAFQAPKRVKVETIEEEILDDGAKDQDSDDPDFKVVHKTRKGPKKRGRGRPRKIKIEDEENKVPSAASSSPSKPGKKMRLKYELDQRKFRCKFPNCPESETAFKNRNEFEQHFLEVHMKEEHRVIPCLVR